MKKIFFLIFISILSFNLFCQNITFEDVKTRYEKLINLPELENLRTFSTALDLYSQGKEYASLKKHADYQNSFLELNRTTKNVLGNFENPWDDEPEPESYKNAFSTKFISEKLYYFVVARNTYITQRIVFYRVFISVSSVLVIFIFIFFFFFMNYKKEKQESLIFSQAMIIGQEAERKRISEDLHDTIAQNLKAQKFQVLNTIEKNKEGLNIETDLGEILTKSKANIVEIRSICQNLFPPDFENQKLDWIIAELCDNTKKNTGINCTYMVDAESPFTKLEKDEKLNLFRIIQEAVNNAVSHSECTEIQIYITKKELVISDNGKGFDYQKKITAETGHFGLRSIKERAAILNLSFDIKSSEKGTSIYLKI